MTDNYIEESTFTIPHLQNGVHNLGDLYDCRRSVAVQHNLIAGPASSLEHIQATPLRNEDYTFMHVKSELDKTKNLKIAGHISIDFLIKAISLDGGIEYKAEEKENCESFIVNYTNEDHKIYLIPPLGNNVNRHLIEQLKSKEIQATHIVGGIIVGGEVHGVVEVKHKADSSKWNLAGSVSKKNSTEDNIESGDTKQNESLRKFIWGKKILEKLSGCVTGELKASWLSADKNNESDIRVSFKAKPTSTDARSTTIGETNSGNGPPGSVESMFDFIENMPKVIRKEISFQRFGKDIFGVPIRFILYPLSHYIDFNAQRMYKQLYDSLMKKFKETVSQIIDIQQNSYVKKLILEEDEDLRFLLDSKSPLSDDVSRFEEELKVIGTDFELRCRKVILDYKFGKHSQEDIADIVKTFDLSKAGSAGTKVHEFVTTGRLELLNGQVFQATSKMVIFKDRGNLDKWYEAETRPLLLMETKLPNQPGAIKGLSQLSEFLHNLGVQVGMAIPSVSKEATLTLKFSERKSVFGGDEMTHALDALKTMACIAEPTTATFYRIIASLKGDRLSISKKNACELDQIVSQIVLVRSSYDSLCCLNSLADLRKQMSAVEENYYLFCLPINAPDTDLELLSKWEEIAKHIPDARWVAYNFDFPNLKEAPLLMIFKDNRLQVICFDYLDVLYLKHQLLKTTSKDLTMLSPEKLQSCLYPERAKYALAILSRLEPLRHVQFVENHELLKTGTDKVVEELLVRLRSFLSEDTSHIALEVDESVEEALRKLVKEYCSSQQIFEEPLITRMTNYGQNFQPYLLLHSVSPYKHGKGLRLLYEGIRQLNSLNDCEALQDIIQRVSSTLDETQIQALWKNSQWQFLVLMCMESERNAIVIRALWEWLQIMDNKHAFPENIKTKLDERFKMFSKNLKTVKDVAKFFQDTIDLYEQVPRDFQKILTDSLIDSKQLEREFCELLARPDWNSEGSLAEMQWDMSKVKLALRCLTESIQSKEALTLATDFNLIFWKMPVTQHDEQLGNDKGKEVCSRFRPIVGNHLRLITDKEYMTVKRINAQPLIRADSNMPLLLSLVPYILQEIKMWNGNILKPSELSRISRAEQSSTDEGGFSDDPFIADETSSLFVIQDKATDPVDSVARLDIFAYFINTADCFLAREIHRVISKFPMPISLVVPDFLQERKYIITVPILKNLVVKWETADVNENQASEDGNSCNEKDYMKKDSHIVENYLFSSPFRLLVAIRLGTHTPGKSQLLNQLMTGNNFFSAFGEPGGERGPPCTLDGTVELAWLTQETCDYAVWKLVLKGHYTRHKDEIVLLANVHGDATQHLDILNYLKKLTFGFLVFMMPEEGVRKKWETLTSQINGKPVTFVRVDPLDYNEKNPQMVLTHDLTHEVTKSKLRTLLKRALTHTKEAVPLYIRDVPNTDLEKSVGLRFAIVATTDEAEQLGKEISKLTCVTTKACMNTFLSKGYDGWKDNEELKTIVGLATQLLNCSKGIDLKKAVSYLETELSQMSASESLCARLRVTETQRHLHHYENNSKIEGQTEAMEQDAHNEEIRGLTGKLQFHMTQADNANLDIEHFFRVFSYIHRIALSHYSTNKLHDSGVLELPKYYASLLLEGQALEILNGDTSEIPIDWLRAIFRHVDELRPNLRVFVISIIGLQSSGKSTLLNALFSCRFAVSVGRCSRGLYMRMVFLEEDLRKEHGYDAIILIDTEGLASSEKMNDVDASRKDRLLATFAMGLSNLTIVNILGEDLTKITDILQIVIVTMARLREADVKPDMLVVQHLLERNSSKLDDAKRQFIDAINKAFDLVHENDVEIGATHTACLTELIKGIMRNDVFLQFGSFKNGSSVHAPPSESYHSDVVDLYKLLLGKARDSKYKLSIQRWFQLTENYWSSVKQEKFALDFKSAQHIRDYLNYSKKVTKLKEAIGQALASHADKMSNVMEDKISTGLTGNPRKQLEDLREEVTKEICAQLKTIPCCCEQKCHYCEIFVSENKILSMEIKGSKWEFELVETIESCISRKREREVTILKQMFDVSIYRRGCFSEFSDLITKELKKELKERPDGKFSEKEKTEISARIWTHVKDIVSKKEKGLSLMDEIENAIIADFEPIYPGIWQRIIYNSSENNLKSGKAKKSCRFLGIGNKEQPLENREYYQLIQKVQHAVTAVLTNSNPNCFSVGMKFEAGMITAIRGSIPDMLKQYETEAEVELINNFKENVIVYALGVFIEKMKTLQEKWDSQNKRSLVLLENENDYKDEISTRLDHGFSIVADGYVQASYIIDAAKEQARKAAFTDKMELVLDTPWMINSENVRLQYFEEMALEVSKGQKERALAHFRHPRESIETWFKDKIELIYSKEKVQLTHEETLTRYIDSVCQKVKNFTSFEKLQGFLKQYHKSADSESYGKAELRENAFVSLQNRIAHKLQEFSEAHQTEYVTIARKLHEFSETHQSEYVIVASKIQDFFTTHHSEFVTIARKLKEFSVTKQSECATIANKLKEFSDIHQSECVNIGRKIREFSESHQSKFVTVGRKLKEFAKTHQSEFVTIAIRLQEFCKTHQSEFVTIASELKEFCKIRQSEYVTFARELKEFSETHQSDDVTIARELKEFSETHQSEFVNIARKLKEFSETHQSVYGTIACKLKEFSKTHQIKFVTLALASEHERVMNRLGCTEYCPWCGALCWGSRGHHEDSGETQKHHSCHQPNGLIGIEVRHNRTQFLDPRGCQDISNSEPVFLDGYENPGMPWSQVKIQYFGSWKFDSHTIKQFDEMMHWFFQELHEDMSAASSKSPVPADLLDIFKCKGLKLADILATVRSVKD